MATSIRKRRIDPDRIRSRLYRIVLNGQDRDAVQAARVLLGEKHDTEAAEPDPDLLAELAAAVKEQEL